MKSRTRPAHASARAGRLPGAPAGGLPAGAARRAWRHPAPWAALLALVLYLPAIPYGFVRDDHTLIERNPFMRQDGWFVKLVSSDFWASGGGASGLWRPVVTASFWAEGRMAGWAPGSFHVVNAVAHAGTSALLASLVLGAGAPLAAAWCAALWFAAMPAHVESVAWIAGRTDVFAALFFLLALWWDRRARVGGRAWPGWGPLMALALALGSKEVAAPFVAVAAIGAWGDARRAGRSGRARATLRWVLPYAVLTLVYLAAHLAVSDPPATVAWLDGAARAARRAAGWTMLPGYVAFLWTWFPHAPDRMLALPPAGVTPLVILGGVLQFGCAVATGWLAGRGSRLAIPLSIFWLALLPTSVVAWTGGMFAHAERLLYLGSTGAAWMVGEGVARLAAAGGHGGVTGGRGGARVEAGGAAARRGGAARLAAWALGVTLVLGSGVETARLLPAWRSDATMYEAMTRVQPANPLGHVGLAESFAAVGQIEAAEAALARAAALAPARPEVHVSRAGLDFRRGDWEAALAAARRALALDSLRSEPRLIEAAALLRLRRLDEAGTRIVALEARMPDAPQVASLAGQWHALQGRDAEAIPLLERASRWDADDAVLWMTLGVAAQRSGRPAQAARALERGLALAPGHYEGWLQLAVARHALGDAAGRDAALARAQALPGAVDGRVAALRAQLGPPSR